MAINFLLGSGHTAELTVHSDQGWHYKMQPYRTMLAQTLAISPIGIHSYSHAENLFRSSRHSKADEVSSPRDTLFRWG